MSAQTTTSTRFDAYESAKRLIERLPPGKSGDVEVQHFDVTKKQADFGNLLSMIGGSPEQTVEPGHYVKLIVGKKLMMSNTQMEVRTNTGIIHRATGDVLIGGLGLGMVIHALADREQCKRERWMAAPIRSVTIVEKSRHVIKLVRPHLPIAPFKIKVVNADVFKWRPPKGARFQTIYWDIWPESGQDSLDEMATLNRRSAKFFDRTAPGAWRSAWRMETLRRERRREMLAW